MPTTPESREALRWRHEGPEGAVEIEARPGSGPIAHVLLARPAAAVDDALARQQLELIFEASPLALVISDANRRVQLWSRSAERAFGWTREEIVGQTYPLIADAALFDQLWRNLEQGRGRITAKVVAELVDLVEDDDRVVGAGALEGLDDATRERADIGAPVAADLGLVTDAAEADADEAATDGPGHALAQRGLADAGRARQAQDRPLLRGVELEHGHVLEDPLLDLLEVVVVLVEDVADRADLELVLGGDRPGQIDQPLEVGPRDRVLGARRLHLLEPVELLEGDLLGLLRHLGVGDLLLELVGLGVLVVDLAELALDRLELLTQHVLALRVAHLFLDLGVDA
ncbi:MAG: PAS domain-containing protein, partial [Myxococcales bacterium]|nr:PAS domain-containing protein [Myxococcales bacterium]